ncbi:MULTISPECIES: hypothetical protein [unclassified Microcoleus]|uniref:hypothetical protein n=1 Tax=unclassified Microcoleus TaxID=2642155 RepID=UPI0025D62F3E|nr:MULTISPECIES: hypothetical protein [unclassified Microcoleus]
MIYSLKLTLFHQCYSVKSITVRSFRSPLLRAGAIAIALFGLIGLRLATVRLGRKLLFTALEFSLILLPIESK